MVPSVGVLLLAMSAAWVWPSTAWAEAPGASNWAETAHGGVRLIAATEAVGSGETVPVGLQFRMNPGWHIYWRSPGDAGYPPRVDWSGSDNLASAEVAWPAPLRFSDAGLETIGYSEGVVLPIDVRLRRPGEPLSLRASVDYLTCADICVPYVADLELTLAAGPAQPSPFAHELARAQSTVPGDGVAAGLAIDRVRQVEEAAWPAIAVDVRASAPLTAPDVFVEGSAPLVFHAPTVRRANDGLAATFTVPVGNTEALPQLAGQPVTVTVVDGERSVERTTIVSTASAAAVGMHAERGLLLILGLALLGGVILNLMPCVLPVLSMKLLAVVGHGGSDRRAVRAGFVAAAFGILFSFMVLAGALLLVRATGTSIGWGLQFQQPWFLTAMILIVTLFACNLWGLYQVPIPRLFGLASEHASRVHGLGGHFLTGALATLLATPCSAPFLGTAVGFALSRGPAEIVLVFAVIGVGLAAPYLVVAAFPGLATRMPRPGPWMRRLRQVLGLALAATGGWLAWVLMGQVGTAAALTVAAVACAIVLMFVVRSRLPQRFRPAGLAAIAALAIAAFVPPVRPAVDRDSPSGVEAEGLWQPFEPHRIAKLVAEGRVVVVNITADWCITCKVNQRLVLASGPVRARLGDPGVVAMRGDWTSPDEAIARYLARFGRYGIPFDAVYGPGMPDGEALPELLSEEIVLGALDRAGGRLAQR